MDKKMFKILVIDDEADVREPLIHALPRRFNAEVRGSTNGDDAVASVRSWSPDLVLLDIHMPGHMGWDVLREIRQLNDRLKVIIVTALFSIPQEDQEYILQHTSAYLTKPIDLDEISGKIAQVLGREVVK